MVAIVIVPTELKPAAELAVKQLAPESHGESFIVPLKTSISSEEAPTYWACSPIVSREALAQIQQLIHSPPFSPRSVLGISDSETVAVDFEALLNAKGLQRMEVPRA